MMMVIMINLVHQLNCPKKGGEINSNLSLFNKLAI